MTLVIAEAGRSIDLRQRAPTVQELPYARDFLSSPERGRFDRLFWVGGENVVIGGIPQVIVRTQDLNSGEGAIFNSARANRVPSLGDQEKLQKFLDDLHVEIESTRGKDDFCSVEEKTPKDDFHGERIRGEYATTARN